MTRYSCGNPRRLLAVTLAGIANAIEFLEVRDHDEPIEGLRQRTLLVHLVLPVPAGLAPSWIVIDAGERIPRIGVEWAVAADTLPAADAAAMLPGVTRLDRVLVVRTRERGDFSRYRFALVTPGTDQPPPGFDPPLSEVPFSFKVECPSDLDCAQPCTCPPGVHHPPTIDYLAKDYQGFRRIMLERMALLAPDWTERSSADVGVTLVELLAYVADELSYRQDAVATEAYLHTARSRVSLRRHARLVDYHVHDGCNARVWARVTVDASTPSLLLPAGTRLLTRVPDVPGPIAPGSRDEQVALAARPTVFETVDDAVLHGDLGVLHFWTWGRLDASLRIGATSATLRDAHPRLRPGEVIVLAETASPRDRDADADPRRRYPVRLVDVQVSTDPAGALFPEGVTDVTEIRWHPDDALPTTLCLAVDGVETAQAWGNIVLADHGARVEGDLLGIVPEPHLERAAAACDTDPTRIPPRFRPALGIRPLTRAPAQPRAVLLEVPLTPALTAELAGGTVGDEFQAVFTSLDVIVPDLTPILGGGGLYGIGIGDTAWTVRDTGAGTLEVLAPPRPAVDALAADPRHADPAITVRGTQPEGTFEWTALQDLLGSSADQRAFVIETEDDGTAILRFGDGEYGAAPVPGTVFAADYRVGNGRSGNVGRETLAHIVTGLTEVLAVSNPLPAAGGADPETSDEIRRDAPATLAVQERAVTASDYEAMAVRSRSVARAAASFRWTGSWNTVFVTADRVGGAPVDGAFEAGLRADLERYRMAGYDLEVDGPRFVSLEIALHVCVAPGHHRADVAAAAREILSNRVLTDGRLGLFHPDRFTFGQPVHASDLLVALHAIEGVESVEIGLFQRQHEPETSGLDGGVLPMGRLEVARLDNDPNFPERGVLQLSYGGGM
ncbi:MAG: putative baseplate assembly protein [Microbacterium sp.]